MSQLKTWQVHLDLRDGTFTINPVNEIDENYEVNVPRHYERKYTIIYVQAIKVTTAFKLANEIMAATPGPA